MTIDKDIKKSLPLAVPDYDLLKLSLKSYLSGQEEFKDYNFDGSALSILLEVMSVNSHYNAFFLNQVGNEAFLTTAYKRSSIVSKAESLGYTPRTITSAKALIQLEITPINAIYPPSYTINTPAFTSIIDSGNYIFTSKENININELNGRYISEPFEIIEGKPFIVTASITQDMLDNGLVIPNFNVDAATIKIIVNDDSSTNYYAYEKVENIIDINGLSRIYFLSENENGLLVIRFGDGIIGKSPNLNSPVIIEYIISSGEAANGITSFVFGNNLTDAFGTVSVNSIASGGVEKESTESIKRNAKFFRTTQNRAVNSFDYKHVIGRKFSNIEDMVTYGGEDVFPPKYGKVIVAIKPLSGLYLTDLEKSNLIKIIKSYNVLGIQPLIYEPDYVYLNVNSIVSYNKTVFNSNEPYLKEVIKTSIYKYQDDNLDGFSRNFRFSVLARYIDFANNSIISNITTITLEKQFVIEANKRSFIESTFNTSIQANSILSSKFKYNGYSNCFIQDVNGKLNIYNYLDTIKTIIENNIGDIDYDTGVISVPSITVEKLDTLTNINPVTLDLYISFTAIPIEKDIITKENIILQINKVNVDVVKFGNAR